MYSIIFVAILVIIFLIAIFIALDKVLFKEENPTSVKIAAICGITIGIVGFIFSLIKNPSQITHLKERSEIINEIMIKSFPTTMNFIFPGATLIKKILFFLLTFVLSIVSFWLYRKIFHNKPPKFGIGTIIVLCISFPIYLVNHGFIELLSSDLDHAFWLQWSTYGLAIFKAWLMYFIADKIVENFHP
jgi:hypothetical protein